MKAIYSEKQDVFLVTLPKSKVLPLEHFYIETMQVTCNDMYTILMEYVEVEEQGHEFKCVANLRECPYLGKYSQIPPIPLDGGFSQKILYSINYVQEVLKIRKNAEWPSNLLKKVRA